MGGTQVRSVGVGGDTGKPQVGAHEEKKNRLWGWGGGGRTGAPHSQKEARVHGKRTAHADGCLVRVQGKQAQQQMVQEENLGNANAVVAMCAGADRSAGQPNFYSFTQQTSPPLQ